MMEVILDVDGVLARCHEDAVREYGYYEPYPLGMRVKDVLHDLHPYLQDVSHDAFWAKFEYDFWANLRTHDYWPHFWDYMNAKFGNENIFIATRPTHNPASAAGKMEWLHRHLPHTVAGFSIIKEKHWLASPNRLLIDDSQSNIDKFVEAGGQGFLWRQPWNGLPYRTWLGRVIELEQFIEFGV